MGLFNFFRSIQKNKNHNINGYYDAPTRDTTEIPEEIFIEKTNNKEQSNDGKEQPVNNVVIVKHNLVGIEEIFEYIQKDLSEDGYKDAFSVTDEVYKSEGVKRIKSQLEILLKQTETYYLNILKKIDYTIKLRARMGLANLVEEMEIQKNVIEDHLEIINKIRQDMHNNTGLVQNLILSYERGFTKGVAAITYSKVFGNNNNNN